jgi:signal transduction histidine kinase
MRLMLRFPVLTRNWVVTSISIHSGGTASQLCRLLRGPVRCVQGYTVDTYLVPRHRELSPLVALIPIQPVHGDPLIVALTSLLGLQWLLHIAQRWHNRSVLKEGEELALEMHDTLAQSFTGIAYQLQAARLEHRGVDKVQAHIRNAIQMVQMSHKEASRTIAALRPQYQDVTGILNALKEAAERLSDGGNLRITTSLAGRSAQLPLEVTDALFRIGQEAVSNSIQHAGCKELRIALQLSKREVQLCVEDDGGGFSEQTVAAGLGIKGMRSRAAAARAQFDLTTTAGTGTRITVTASLPMTRGLRYRLRAMLRATFASASSE